MYCKSSLNYVKTKSGRIVKPVSRYGEWLEENQNSQITIAKSKNKKFIAKCPTNLTQRYENCTTVLEDKKGDNVVYNECRNANRIKVPKKNQNPGPNFTKICTISSQNKLWERPNITSPETKLKCPNAQKVKKLLDLEKWIAETPDITIKIKTDLLNKEKSPNLKSHSTRESNTMLKYKPKSACLPTNLYSTLNKGQTFIDKEKLFGSKTLSWRRGFKKGNSRNETRAALSRNVKNENLKILFDSKIVETEAKRL